MAIVIYQHRRGTTSDWENDKTLIPKEGELLIEETSQGVKIKIGDGQHTFEELSYAPGDTYIKLKELDSQISALEKLFNSKSTELDSVTTIDELKAFVATGLNAAAEVAAARVLSNGETPTDDNGNSSLHVTIEDIDSRLRDLDASLTKFKNAEAVDGLQYENNQLWLTANGVQVGDAVEVVSGTGSGGGGSAASVLTLTRHNGPSLNVSADDKVFLEFTVTSTSAENPNESTGDIICDIYRDNTIINTRTIQQGSNTIEVTSYCQEGSNSFKIRCTDNYGSYRILPYSVTVTELSISSSFSVSSYVTENTTFRYTIYGENIKKTVHFKLKDISRSNTEEEEIFTQVASDSGKTYSVLLPLKEKGHGVYHLRVYAEATLEGASEPIMSNVLEYDLMYFDPADTTQTLPLIASSFATTQVVQGTRLYIPFLVVDPNPNRIRTEVSLNIYHRENGEEKLYHDTSIVTERSQSIWEVADYPAGDSVTFEISYTDVNDITYTRKHTLKVTALEIPVESVEDGLELYLTSTGKTNDSVNKESWTFTDAQNNTVTTTFNDFNWKSNGWVQDSDGITCLRVSNGATASINFKPFEKNFINTGKTIEIEFAVRNVSDNDAVLFSCEDTTSKTASFYATPSKFVFNSALTNLSCNYKEDRRVRVSVSIEDTANATNFIYLYLNGVLSGITQYSATADNFKQTIPATITLGNPSCVLDIYQIRIYDHSLTSTQVLHNYISDLMSPEEKVAAYNQNNVLFDDMDEVSYAKVYDKIPTVVFIGPMPTYKGDKKKNLVRMIYHNPIDNIDYDNMLDQIDVQGTSSAGYVRKNWKVKLAEEETLIPNELAAKVYCIKVDYAEATGTHNTQNANLVETFYTEPIPPKNTENVPEGWSSEKIEDLSKVRTTITGFPCLVFQLDPGDGVDVQSFTINDLKTNKSLKFSSKGNFNYDKDAEDVFAFTSDFDTECWEFLNNSETTAFLTEWPDAPEDYWEARYHARLGDLEDAEVSENAELAASIRTEMFTRFKELYQWVHSTARGSYKDASGNVIYFATGNNLSEDTLNSEASWNYTTLEDGTTSYKYTTDTDEYRLAKFKAEFEQYFNLHYTAVYYVYTFFALMVDQRAKNLFLTYWHDNAFDNSTNGRWYPYFYDNDTSYGINNTGHLSFDYYHEDDEEVASGYVFNGHNSVLWCNFRDAFASKIQSTYEELRGGALTGDKIISRFITQGSERYGATVYNEDAWYKYIVIATKESDYDSNGDGIPDQTAAYLYQVRGDGSDHLRYFVENRIKYCDSKWLCGSFITDIATLRIYCDNRATITLTPYSNTYCGVGYGAASGDNVTKVIKHKKCVAGQEYEFISDDEQMNDRETYIYGASNIASLGDLSPLKCKLVSIGGMSKLTTLKLGNEDESYVNENLTTVSTASNPLLTEIDISNSPNMIEALDISGCSGIQQVLAKGTNIPAVILPKGGDIHTLRLPGSVTNLSIVNHIKLKDWDDNTNTGLHYGANNNKDDYAKLETLWIENTQLNVQALLDKCLSNTNNKLTYIRLSGINWEYDTGEEALTSLRKYYSKEVVDAAGNTTTQIFKGLDSNGVYKEDSGQLGPSFIGNLHVSTLTGDQYNEIKQMFPTLDITFDQLTSTVIFKRETGEELGRTTVANPAIVGDKPLLDGNSCIDPTTSYGALGYTPVKSKTAAHSYTFAGWSKDPEATDPDPNALNHILGDVTLYTVWTVTDKYYNLSFYNGDELLKTYSVKYGSFYYNTAEDLGEEGSSLPIEDAAERYPYNAEFNGTDNAVNKLKNPINPSANYYKFAGWYPAITADYPIVANINVTATYEVIPELVPEITALGSDIVRYTVVDETKQTIALVEYLGSETAFTIRDTYDVAVTTDSTITYTVTEIGSEADGTPFINAQVQYVSLPETIEKIHSGAFCDATGLLEIYIPTNVTYIGSHAFKNCSSLQKIIYAASDAKVAASVEKDSKNRPFNNLSAKTVQIDIKPSVNQIPNYLFYQESNLVENVTVTFDSPNNVTNIGKYSFRQLPVFSRVAPQFCGDIENGEKLTEQLKTFELPDGLLGMDTSAFEYNDTCECLILPSSLETAGATIFKGWSKLKQITINSSTREFAEKLVGQFDHSCNLKHVHISEESSALRFNYDIDVSAPYKCLVSTLDDAGTLQVLLGTSETILYEDSPVKIIRDYAFSGLADDLNSSETFEGLKTIHIPAATEEIQDNAFRLCGLTNVTFSDSSNLKTIGFAAFGHNKLSEVTLPNSVTSIGDYAFANNTLMTTFSCLATELPSFGGANVFSSCSALKELYFNCSAPDSSTVLNIGLSTKVGDNYVPREDVTLYFKDEAGNDVGYKYTADFTLQIITQTEE